MANNLIPFDLEKEKKFSSNSGLAADFWKGATVNVLIQTWTKVLDNKKTTDRAKNGEGSLGCWLVDEAGNKGWANLSHLGMLMHQTLSADDKKLYFKKKDGKVHIILDSNQRLTIEMSDKDKPTIVKVAKPIDEANNNDDDDDDE